MERSLTAGRVSTVRRFGWLGVASMLALALLAPSAGLVSALTGAVYTSNEDGSIINANIYGTKADVYLTGGPCQGGSHLVAGDYYFQVSSPNGVLLSSDAVGQRKFSVGANGFISTAMAGHVTHAVTCNPPVSGITIQLLPYLDTPNSGGEYKLTIATAASVEACSGFSAASTTFEICNQADQKSDNFKVGAVASPIVTEAPPPTAPPTAPPTTPPTTPPTVAPTPTFVQSVLAETGTPSVTLPPTDALSGSSAPADGTWRLVLIAMAALLASVLVMTPARATRRR